MTELRGKMFERKRGKSTFSRSKQKQKTWSEWGEKPVLLRLALQRKRKQKARGRQSKIRRGRGCLIQLSNPS